jgi:hypothetical protein
LHQLRVRPATFSFHKLCFISSPFSPFTPTSARPAHPAPKLLRCKGDNRATTSLGSARSKRLSRGPTGRFVVTSLFFIDLKLC